MTCVEDHLTALRVMDAFVAQRDKPSEWCKENWLRFQYLHEAQKISTQLLDALKNIPVEGLNLEHKDFFTEKDDAVKKRMESERVCFF